MAKKVKNKRVIAVLNFPPKVPALIIYCRNIILRLDGNADVPLPYPANTSSLADATAHIDALEASEAEALSRESGSSDTRDVDLELVKFDMRTFRAMVQIIADSNPTRARAIIESTGMHVKKDGVRKPRVFGARNTLVSGIIALIAAGIAGNRGAHQWYYSTDLVNFSNPVHLPVSSKASILAPGLTPGVKYAFFHIAVAPGAEQVVEGPVFLMVI
jgi:hypothetical protein